MIAIDPVIAWIMTLALAIVFLSSCVHKLRQRAAFTGILRDYRVLPGALVRPVAMLVIAAEAVAGSGALLSVTRRYALSLMLVLLVLYTSAIAINLLRGRSEIDCGCGSAARGQRLSPALVIRNALMMLVVAVALLPVTGRALGWFDSVIALAGAAALVLVYIAGTQLIANQPKLDQLKATHG